MPTINLKGTLMDNLKIFESSEFGCIRAITQGGDPWFVGKDIANALGYKREADAIRVHVEETDKGVGEIQTPGGIQTMTIINESGMYSLIFGSKLESAKRFKYWVTSEVLPAIRKHGGYLTQEKVEEALLNPDVLIRLATDLKEEREKRRALEAQAEADKPKVIFTDAVSVTDQTILIGDLAKLIQQNGISIGQRRLFQWMRDQGYLIKRKGADWNSPTQRAMEMGLFKVKETAITHSDGHVSINRTTKVTGKGQQYFVNKFLREQ